MWECVDGPQEEGRKVVRNWTRPERNGLGNVRSGLRCLTDFSTNFFQYKTSHDCPNMHSRQSLSLDNIPAILPQERIQSRAPCRVMLEMGSFLAQPG